MRLPPVELRDPSGRHAPGFQMRANTQRCHEWDIELRQLAYGGVVEMVIVVVGDDDQVDVRKGSDSNGYRLKALRTEEPRGGCAGSPHRIRQYTIAIDL